MTEPGHTSARTWASRAGEAVAACRARGGDGHFLSAPPASERAIAKIEAQLGVAIPSSFRTVLATCASRFEVRWQLPDAVDPPIRGIFSGGFSWDVDALADLAREHRDWVESCFSDPHNPYDRVWHRKLAVCPVPNGDMIGIDLVDPAQPLVYLSHDDGEGHGALLGSSFADGVDRWSQLGFVGPEEWQWYDFVDEARRLDPTSANAKTWVEWFGLGTR